MFANAKSTQKTVLQLALELGVRAETVLQVLQQLGLDVVDPSTLIGADTESALVRKMADDGLIPTKLLSKRHRRRIGSKPLVNDDILEEALGASEFGYLKSSIPRILRQQNGISEKPSVLQRWFGKKNTLADAIKNHEFTNEELNTLLFPPVRQTRSSHAPALKERKYPLSPTDRSPERPADKTKIETAEAIVVDLPDTSRMEVKETPEEIAELDAESRQNTTTESETEIREAEEIPPEPEEIKENLSEIAETDELATEPVEAAENQPEDNVTDEITADSEAASANLPSTPEVALSSEPADENESVIPEEELSPEEFETEIESTEASPLDESKREPLAEVVLPDDTTPPPNLLERFFSQIQFTSTELWVLMGGAVITMLTILGIMTFWWLTRSPKAQEEMLKKADEYYHTAALPTAELPQAQENHQKAVEEYEKFLKKFPNHPRALEALFNLSDSYFQLAENFEKEGKPNKSDEPYRKAADAYREYLRVLDLHKEKPSPTETESPIPEAVRRREALLRIAQAKRKLKVFDDAVATLTEILEHESKSDSTYAVLLDLGNTYRDWSKVNKEQPQQLVKEAVLAYQKALEKIPADSHSERMKLNAEIGDIYTTQYDRADQAQKTVEADANLKEAITYLERAKEEAQKIEKTKTPEKLLVYKRLGDLYLIQGRKSGDAWRMAEESAEPYPQGIFYKEQLIQEAEREKKTTQDYVDKANALYNELLQSPKPPEPQIYQEALLNQAETFLILRDYPGAIAAGERVLSTTRGPLDKTIKTKTYYLLGNAAWEQAKTTLDYDLVKKYYREGLALDAFYPKENGEISHLADIRLTNAYFLLDKNYEEAIRRFSEDVKRYPDSGYTYLTLYWYAKALEEYGDKLQAQAEKDPQNAKALQTKAKSLFQEARDAYGRAIVSRNKSRVVDTKDQRYLIEITFNRGFTANKAGLYTGNDGAVKLLEEALEKYQNNEVAQKFIPAAVETLGDMNAVLGNDDRAAQYYLTYRKNAFEDSQARVTMKLADTYLRELSFDKAREWYQTIAQEYPPPTARDIQREEKKGKTPTKGPGYEALKKIAESYYLEAAGAVDPQQKLHQALETYQQIAQRYPRNSANASISADPEIQRMMANIFYELEKYPEALSNYTAFLNLNPDYPKRGTVYFQMGKANMKLDRLDDAINAFTQTTPDTVESAEQYADNLIWLGQAYQKKAENYRIANNVSMYEQYLQLAKKVYDGIRVSQDSNKLKQAALATQVIDSLIASLKGVKP